MAHSELPSTAETAGFTPFVELKIKTLEMSHWRHCFLEGGNYVVFSRNPRRKRSSYLKKRRKRSSYLKKKRRKKLNNPQSSSKGVKM